VNAAALSRLTDTAYADIRRVENGSLREIVIPPGDLTS